MYGKKIATLLTHWRVACLSLYSWWGGYEPSIDSFHQSDLIAVQGIPTFRYSVHSAPMSRLFFSAPVRFYLYIPAFGFPVYSSPVVSLSWLYFSAPITSFLCGPVSRYIVVFHSKYPCLSWCCSNCSAAPMNGIDLLFPMCSFSCWM